MDIITFEYFRDWCMSRHDEVCNQKYAKVLPYSQHLHYVHAQAKKFSHLIPGDKLFLVKAACYGHDMIEDARVTYNDIIEIGRKKGMAQQEAEELAEIIFLCTEMRGRNRAERKNEEFYRTLVENELAVFVKLCDIIANIKYSLLENSSMYEKYKAEWPKIKRYLGNHLITYKEMVLYINKLLEL
jgi:hypothetical protein